MSISGHGNAFPNDGQIPDLLLVIYIHDHAITALAGRSVVRRSLTIVFKTVIANEISEFYAPLYRFCILCFSARQIKTRLS